MLRAGSISSVQSEDTPGDFLKWKGLLSRFDEIMSIRPKTQYISSVDVERTEVEPAMSHIRSSLPLPKGKACTEAPPPVIPDCEGDEADACAAANEEMELLSDVNLRPWTKKKGPEAEVLLGERYVGSITLPTLFVWAEKESEPRGWDVQRPWCV